jgi:hypothetical protein
MVWMILISHEPFLGGCIVISNVGIYHEYRNRGSLWNTILPGIWCSHMIARSPLYKVRIVPCGVEVRQNLIRSWTTPPSRNNRTQRRNRKQAPNWFGKHDDPHPLPRRPNHFYMSPKMRGDGEIELRKSCLLRDGASLSSAPKANADPIAFQRNGLRRRRTNGR